MSIPSDENILVVIKELEERRKRDAELIKNLSVAQSFADHWEISRNCNIMLQTDGKIIHANKRLCDVLGYRYEELKGRMFFDFIHPNDIKETEEAFRGMLSGEVIAVERFVNRYITKDGNSVVLMWSGVMLNHDVISGTAQIIQACVSETSMVCYCQNNNKENCYRDKERSSNKISEIMMDALKSRKFITKI